MKKIILLTLLVPVLAYGQIIDNFESGSIVNWVQGNEVHWKADGTGCISGDFSLHHVFDNPASGSDCIGLPLTDLHPEKGATQWKFLIRHGCDPSSSNNWAVYLMSDADPVSFYGGASINGFAVGVNLTGYDDSLRLWKIKNGSVSVILNTGINWQNDIGTARAAGIVAVRTGTGGWIISVYYSDNTLIRSGSGFDSELFNPAWFLLNYRYTATRDRLLWLDDLEISGVFYRDTEPPVVLECSVKGRKLLEVAFNEEISEDDCNPSNFISGDPGNSVTEVRFKTKTCLVLKFSEEFSNKQENSLTIISLCDKAGNCTANKEVKFMPVWAEAGDVIITEIMADPLPEVKLPGREFFEIHNRSAFGIDTDGWIYTAGDQKILMPRIGIAPGEYVILCSVSDTALFREYGRTQGLKPFPVLTDSGKLICLSDSLGNLLHGVEYSSKWYGSALKAAGGWSLEIIDTDFPFFMEGNWEASSSAKGGTPGRTNSASRANPDISFYGILNAFPLDSVTVSMQLSETVSRLPARPGIINIGNEPVSSVSHDDILLRRFRLKSSFPLIRGKVYELHLSDEVADYTGNQPSRSCHRFGIPEQALKGDIVFNELLFNPLPGDPDYVELVNCSEKSVDVSRLYLASVSETGDTSAPYRVSEEPKCLVPGDYYVATTDPQKVVDRYFRSEEDNIHYAGSLPSMPDSRGHLLLMNRELKMIDYVIYSEKMHYPLLSGVEGISLEKVRPEALSGSSMNWHSASESSGWGTPGRENSVYSTIPLQDDQVIFSSGRISPDNDGYEDMLVIDLNLEGYGNVVTVTVFNETGGFIRRIAENMLAGSNATIVWDATCRNGSLVERGIYIILIELFNDKGKTRSWKKVCTVVR